MTKVMVVEDELVVATDLQERLERLGYQCCAVVDNGKDALSEALRHQPELVLMDIRIRGRADGIEVAHTLRQHLSTAVVFLTAHADEATVERAVQTEPFGYLIKPFKDRELRATLEMAIYRMRAESKLRTMERWLATTLESIGDGVIALDLSGRVTFVNPVAEILTGWRKSEAVGRPACEVFTLVDERTGETCDFFSQAKAEGTTIHLDEHWAIRTRQGEVIPIDDSLAPIREGDEMTGMVVIFRDRRARVNAQKEKDRMEARLREAQKLEGLGLISAGVAHDFNNLLCIISGYAALSLQQAEHLPELTHYLNEIQQAQSRAAQLCDQMLAYAGQGRTVNSPIKLNQLVETTSDLLRQLLPERVTMDYDFAAALPAVLGDPRQLQQVVMNLVLNAAEASEDEGRIRLKTRLGHFDSLQLSHARLNPEAGPGDYLVLEVQDWGTGMTELVQEKLFDAFFTTKFHGRGLGLAALAGAVRAHQGCVLVESSPGYGSRFQVLLPASSAVSSAPVASQDSDRSTYSGLTLVADDDPALRRLLQRVLMGLGFEVITASDGAEAAQVTLERSDELRLVLMDLTMPSLSGRRALEAIRQFNQSLPVIAMSGYDCDGSEISAFSGFLHKPFKLSDLREVLNLALSH